MSDVLLRDLQISPGCEVRQLSGRRFDRLNFGNVNILSVCLFHRTKRCVTKSGLSAYGANSSIYGPNSAIDVLSAGE